MQVTYQKQGAFIECKQKGCNQKFHQNDEKQVRCTVCLRLIRLGVEKEEDK
jgi:hypothetical protein